MLKAILILIACDIGTGIFNAIMHKKLTSKRSYIGMFKKISIIAVVMMGFIIEEHMKIPNVGEMVCTFFIITESLSILENLKSLGIPIPPFISGIINSNGKEDDKEGDKK